MPQGSVLGPILFLIYINDLDENVKCKISKFADDTKIANRVISLSQHQELQNDLNTLGEWAVDSQMFFNVDKCKVLHIGNRNVQANYMMNGKQLAKVEQEKDLGVVISSDLKPSKQCSEVVKTANKLIGFIGRSFESRTEEIILNLYNALVRPHLEYCVQCWSPYYKKDIDKLEGVQRRMTKLIPRLRNKPYEERLNELNLESLRVTVPEIWPGQKWRKKKKKKKKKKRKKNEHGQNYIASPTGIANENSMSELRRRSLT